METFFEPTTEAEKLLAGGTSFESKDFLVELLRSDIVVLGKATPLEKGGHTLHFRTVGTRAGGSAVFAFTSQEAFSFYQKRYGLADMETLDLHAEDFFSAVCHSYDVVLNYGHSVAPYFPKGSLIPADTAPCSS
jgi:hypothetical protein